MHGSIFCINFLLIILSIRSQFTSFNKKIETSYYLSENRVHFSLSLNHRLCFPPQWNNGLVLPFVFLLFWVISRLFFCCCSYLIFIHSIYYSPWVLFLCSRHFHYFCVKLAAFFSLYIYFIFLSKYSDFLKHSQNNHLDLFLCFFFPLTLGFADMCLIDPFTKSQYLFHCYRDCQPRKQYYFTFVARFVKSVSILLFFLLPFFQKVTVTATGRSYLLPSDFQHFSPHCFSPPSEIKNAWKFQLSLGHMLLHSFSNKHSSHLHPLGLTWSCSLDVSFSCPRSTAPAFPYSTAALWDAAAVGF